MATGAQGVARRPSKKAAKNLGDSCSTSPERNRKDDVMSGGTLVRMNDRLFTLNISDFSDRIM